MAIDPSTAFVSYSREDWAFAIRVAKDLKAKGAKVWMDKLDIRPGQRWELEVETALNGCSRLLVILSPASVGSSNVLAEAAFAIDEGKEVIPVLYLECKIPFRLRPFQYADFRSSYDEGLQELLATLGRDRAAAETAAATPVLNPQQEPEPGASTIPDVRDGVRADTPEKKERQIEHAQARLEEMRPKTAEQARQTPQPELKSSFFSIFPAWTKAVAAVFAIFIVGFIFYWKFVPSPSQKQTQDFPRVEPRVEPANPPPVAPQEKGEPQKQGGQGQAITPVPSQKKGNTEKSKASVEPANPPPVAPQEKGEPQKQGGQGQAITPVLSQKNGNTEKSKASDASAKNGANEDYQQARVLYEKDASAGNARAMANLGHMYESGLGLPKNYDIARKWYERGAAAGDGLSMVGLCRLYEFGHGVPQDLQKALEWCEKGAAAAAGDAATISDAMHEEHKIRMKIIDSIK